MKIMLNFLKCGKIEVSQSFSDWLVFTTPKKVNCTLSLLSNNTFGQLKCAGKFSLLKLTQILQLWKISLVPFTIYTSQLFIKKIIGSLQILCRLKVSFLGSIIRLFQRLNISRSNTQSPLTLAFYPSLTLAIYPIKAQAFDRRDLRRHSPVGADDAVRFLLFFPR